MGSRMVRLETGLLVSVLSLVSGCSSLAPSVPRKAQSSFAKLVKDASRDMPSNQWTLQHVDAALTRLQTDVQGAGHKKHEQEWDYGSASTGGGVAAVLGQLASKTGLLNSGLFVLLGSQTMDKLYGPAKTKAHYLKMVDLLICMEAQLHTISQSTIDQAKKDAGTADNDPSLGHKAIGMIIQEVDQALAVYRQSVLREGVTSVSKSDFMRFLGEYRAAETGQGNAAKNMAALPTRMSFLANGDTLGASLLTEQANAQQAQADLRSLKVGLEACSKTPGATG
ncbi:MAG TPA: hypothetical protein VM512_10210 [Burkholderiaceae bacterium]|nr:hypothetical protein [Burkholderiaceae bacterium]